MSLYNVEFFDGDLNCIHHDSANIEVIDDDYLAPEPTSFLIGNTESISVRNIAWITGAMKFLGIVTAVEAEEYQTKVTVEPFVSAFNRDVLIDVRWQNKPEGTGNKDYSLEKYLDNIINDEFRNSQDPLWNIPCIETDIITKRYTWDFALESDSFALNRCKVNLRDVILYKALTDYGIALNCYPDFPRKKIRIEIGNATGMADIFEDTAELKFFNINADSNDVVIDSFSVDAASDGANTLKIYSTSSAAWYIVYYLKNDGSWPPYASLEYTSTRDVEPVLPDSGRVLPVQYDLQAVAGTGNTFKKNALNKAKEVFSNITWKSAVELRVGNEDKLIKPQELKVGQICRIWHDGRSFDSVLTGKKFGEETTLVFGAVRTTLTKQIKLNSKKKK